MKHDFLCKFCGIPVRATQFYIGDDYYTNMPYLLPTCEGHKILDAHYTKITLKEAICLKVMKS